MRSKYCLPIRLERIQDVTAQTEAALQDTQYVELWLDYITDIDENTLETLIQKNPGRIVLVFRRDKLAQPEMDTGARRSILMRAAKLDVLIDLDISSQQADVEFLVNLNLKAKFIASFHDYEHTPGNINEVIMAMTEYNPDIYKIATYCSSELDASALISVKASLNQSNVKSIILGMGENGKLARLVCNFWGNELVFAPQDKDTATAPGQFTRTELEEIDRILGEKL